MRTAYREIMDHLSVTEDLRLRILGELRPKRAPSLFGLSIPRVVSAAACLLLLTAAAVGVMHTRLIAPPPTVSSAVGNPVSPTVNTASAEELAALVGFAVTEPEIPFAAEKTEYTAFGKDLAQIEWFGEDESACFRKARGSLDPSGDFSTYESVTEITANGVCVMLKGDSSGYLLAVWEGSDFSYSLRLSQARSEQEWLSLLENCDIS